MTISPFTIADFKHRAPIIATARRGRYLATVTIDGAHGTEIVEVVEGSTAGVTIHDACFPAHNLGNAAWNVVELTDYAELMLASVTR
jgi:hypothetical protein